MKISKGFAVLAICIDSAVVIYLLLLDTFTGFWDISQYSFYVGSTACYGDKLLPYDCGTAVGGGDLGQTERIFLALFSYSLHTTHGPKGIRKI